MENMSPAMLLSVVYNHKPNKEIVLKFYDPKEQKIIIHVDKTHYKPYCYSKLPVKTLHFLNDNKSVSSITEVKKRDLLTDSTITVSKINLNIPLQFSTFDDKAVNRQIGDLLESDVKFYESYMYDNKLIVGKYYEINNGKIIKHDIKMNDYLQDIMQKQVWEKLKNEKILNLNNFQTYIKQWAELLNQPIPIFKRAAFDIEVDAITGRIPDPKNPDRQITAVGFAGTDINTVLVLRRDLVNEGAKELKDDVTVLFFSDEVKMLQHALKLIENQPILLTYNGDDFDMPYLHARALRLGIKDDDNPLFAMRESATLKTGVHLDLYKIVSNKAFQIYVFKNKYSDFKLQSVSKAILGEGKIEYNTNINDLTLNQIANYCYTDARLTYNLTSINNHILMEILVVIARISKMTIDDVSRLRVSQWIRSMHYYEHRQIGAIIPTKAILDQNMDGVKNDAVTKKKKFAGGHVIEPVKGIHFDVTVLDFASLYPSIMKVFNLSYETVRCPHDECKVNKLVGTNHWCCTKNNGITSLLIGSLRDLRVNFYKSLSKNDSITDDQKQSYKVIEQALKVILNASYGVMGADVFSLYYLPVAESTTACGRHIIQSTIKMCEHNKIKVLYGDTDSVFILKPTTEQINNVIKKAKSDHNIELEIDKEFKYLVLSDRKKNYFGLDLSGEIIVKGMTGKKSHTPPFVKKLFTDITEILSKVNNIQEFENSKALVRKKITECNKKLVNLEIPMKDLSFNVMLSKPISDYKKTIPQHVKAAKELSHNREFKKGDIISFVKVINKPNAKLTEITKKSEIDIKKYTEFMSSTLDQIIYSMNLDFDEILGKPKQTGIDQYFYS